MPSYSQGDGTALERLQKIWENYAKDDPLWAIVSWPGKKGGKWKLDEFFKNGKDEVQQPITTLAVWFTSPLRPASQIAVSFRVTNLSPIPWEWEHDGQASSALGNHWLDEHSNLMRLDDGRAPLPLRLDPNDSVDLNLEITAPPRSGGYLLELDHRGGGSHLVHRQWFANL